MTARRLKKSGRLRGRRPTVWSRWPVVPGNWTIVSGDKASSPDDEPSSADAETALRETLALIHLAEPDRQVIVRGDRRLDYERVCTVLALLSAAGFKNVGLVTEKEVR